MQKIRILPTTVTAKIAAGEVIDQPASVIKELIENSLDAQADSIKIVLENSGLKKIVVADNGHGMDKENLTLAALAHSTSKIEKLEDLLNIQTLGFRGEALASIAQVSHLDIKSKVVQAKHGYQTSIRDSKIQECRPIATSQGTTVIITDLFCLLPVRKKFLKSAARELRYVLEIVHRFALAYPRRRFSLVNNGKSILDLAPQKMALRVGTILGRSSFNNFIPLQLESELVSMTGFIAKPQLARKIQSKQYLYLNQRIIKNRLINKNIKQAYGGLLDKNSRPPFVLFLTISPELVDINIHPRKKEVNFFEEKELLKTIHLSIKECLAKSDLSYTFDHYFYPRQSLVARKNRNKILVKLKADNLAASKKLIRETAQVPNIKNQPHDDPIILQLNYLYLITLEDDCIVIVDQHAAHERILFEQFTLAYQKQIQKKFTLEKKTFLELDLVNANLLEERLDELTQLGFKLEKTTEEKFQIIAIPKMLQNQNIKVILLELLERLALSDPNTKIDILGQELIEYLACKTAIKAGEYLKQDERKKLLTELEKCQLPYTCPHGRPISIKIRLSELDRMFFRR